MVLIRDMKEDLKDEIFLKKNTTRKESKRERNGNQQNKEFFLKVAKQPNKNCLLKSRENVCVSRKEQEWKQAF